jgi:hypothetical protein
MQAGTDRYVRQAIAINLFNHLISAVAAPVGFANGGADVSARIGQSSDELRHTVSRGLQSADDSTGAGHELELRSEFRHSDDQDSVHIPTDVPAQLRRAVLIFWAGGGKRDSQPAPPARPARPAPFPGEHQQNHE